MSASNTAPTWARSPGFRSDPGLFDIKKIYMVQCCAFAKCGCIVRFWIRFVVSTGFECFLAWMVFVWIRLLSQFAELMHPIIFSGQDRSATFRSGNRKGVAPEGENHTVSNFPRESAGKMAAARNPSQGRPCPIYCCPSCCRACLYPCPRFADSNADRCLFTFRYFYR